MSRLLGLSLVLMSLLGLSAAGCGEPKKDPKVNPTPANSDGGATKEQPTKDVPETVQSKKDTGKPTVDAPAEVNVTFSLPASVANGKLTINGKEEEVKEGEAQELAFKVPIPKDKDTILVVYDHWPFHYSNTIRTKEVKLANGKDIKVDFHVLDKNNKYPDLIKPIYVPTPPGVVAEMCKLAKVNKDDVVYDIGCGDGRLVIMAVEKFGAKKGVGIDIDPDRIKDSNENAKKAGVTDKVEFRLGDALKIKDLSDATVVLLYVGEDFGKVLEPVLRKTLKPGARIVSHRFPLGDWKPDQQVTVNSKSNANIEGEYTLLLWTIK